MSWGDEGERLLRKKSCLLPRMILPNDYPGQNGQLCSNLHTCHSKWDLHLVLLIYTYIPMIIKKRPFIWEGMGNTGHRVGRVDMGKDREDLWGTKAGRRDVDGGAIWMKTGQEGHGKSPIQLGLHLHVALPHDQSYHLNFSGPAIGWPPALISHAHVLRAI